MSKRIGYSYLYSRSSGDLLLGFRKYERLHGNFLPAYVSKYLKTDIVVESATFASVLEARAKNWIDYLIQSEIRLLGIMTPLS